LKGGDKRHGNEEDNQEGHEEDDQEEEVVFDHFSFAG